MGDRYLTALERRIFFNGQFVRRNRTNEDTRFTSVELIPGDEPAEATNKLYQLEDGRLVWSGAGPTLNTNIVENIPEELEPGEKVWVTDTQSEWIGASNVFFPTLDEGTPWPTKGYKEYIAHLNQDDDDPTVTAVVKNEFDFDVEHSKEDNGVFSVNLTGITGDDMGNPSKLELFAIEGSNYLPGTGIFSANMTEGDFLEARYNSVDMADGQVADDINSNYGVSFKYYPPLP